jgi:hypothetical protein
MPFLRWGRRVDTFSARIERARNEGYRRGFAEGNLFKMALGKTFSREQVLDWLDTVIEEGRSELKEKEGR